MLEASNCKAGDNVALDSVLGASQGREAILILNLSAMRSQQIVDCVLRLSQGRETIQIVNHCGMRLNQVVDKSRFRLRARGAPVSRSVFDSVHIHI